MLNAKVVKRRDARERSLSAPIVLGWDKSASMQMNLIITVLMGYRAKTDLEFGFVS